MKGVHSNIFIFYIYALSYIILWNYMNIELFMVWYTDFNNNAYSKSIQATIFFFTYTVLIYLFSLNYVYIELFIVLHTNLIIMPTLKVYKQLYYFLHIHF